MKNRIKVTSSKDLLTPHIKLKTPLELTFLQHPTVLVSEDHVEKEVEAEISKEEECGEEPPHLELVDNQVWVKVELEGG